MHVQSISKMHARCMFGLLEVQIKYEFSKAELFWDVCDFIWSFIIPYCKSCYESVIFIKSSMTNSDAFAEVCSEFLELYKTSTCSFHPGSINQNIFLRRKGFLFFTHLWWSSWIGIHKTCLFITNFPFPTAALQMLSSLILAR